MALYCYANSDLPFLGDAYHTWEVARTLYDENRETSYVEYRGPFTFILYNLLFKISNLIGVSELITLRFSLSMMFAFLVVYIFPKLYEFILSKRIRILEICLFSLWNFVFFSGYYLYPQTDTTALFFFATGLLALVKALNEGRGRWYALAGILVAFSIMLRLNYVVSVPILLVIIVLRQKLSKRTAFAAVFLLGCFLMPLSALVWMNTSAAPKNSVLEGQLKGGLQFRKVEWNAGDATYPGSLVFPDKRGAEILSKEGIKSSKESFFDGAIPATHYARLWLTYPKDMAIIYGQHFFSGIDIKYNSVYIYDFSRNIMLISAVNFSVLFIALLAATKLVRWCGDMKMQRILMLIALVFPAFSAIPFIVEVRFFMPLIVGYSALGIFALRDCLPYMVRKDFYVQLLIFVGLCLLNSSSMFETTDPVLLW
ncbi:Dolichyl-phosphate-mannose-protein mannosyltransferase [Aureimonas altamirensis DSM 21988]|uniref:Dolichyl-phosphate-mannose-protein mannosyltransferase n=1 Tax=Aureimonas altamirensis DSM 21988 TaxID=1121026 RepID=A0ABY1IRF6_9HYPH|nr:Dolichyl-phosphate-mannose-protein mannosyltransferase [Aureimonas altamirensis DSM 21988]